MLGLTLLVAALWLCPGARASSLCRYYTVRTGTIFDSSNQIYGDLLYYASSTPRLIRHPCDNNIAVYLGTQVFFSKNNFESSLVPLFIPPKFQVSKPEVTMAHFTATVLVLVVDHKVYLYEYNFKAWFQGEGIKGSVTHVSGDNCCYSSHPVCLYVSETVFAYTYGEKVSQTTIYVSKSGGYEFRVYNFPRQKELVGMLGGIFNFYTLSQVGLLLFHNKTAMFSYSEHPLNRSFGHTFSYENMPEVVIPPGQKGILLFWSNQSLFISRNSGQLVMPIYLKESHNAPHYSVSELNLALHNLAANDNEIAVLTVQKNIFYGYMGILSSNLLKFPDPVIWSSQTVLSFTDVGKLEILTPIEDLNFSVFNFEKCLISVQAILMDPKLGVETCKVELLEGEFANEVFIIDMNSKLELMATIIPRPHMSLMPLVLVSNPHSLGLETRMFEDSYTTYRDSKFKLYISLQQQHHSGRTDPNFTSWIKRETASTITVDIANKEISCVNIHPLTALVTIGCNVDKKIIIHKDITSCNKGFLDHVDLQNNFSYTLEKDIYSPNPLGVDLEVNYNYPMLGCPLLVYYDTPWKPVLQLWEGEEFQEIIEAEYVLKEVNGLFTYSYSLTAETAHCTSQPQNWSSLSKSKWGRQNYQSCHDSNNLNPLLWPEVRYEILGGRTDNKLVFEQRNGIYIFSLSVVDPYYSYCQLETLFSIYVYGAVPPTADQLDIPIIVGMFALLLSLWVAYIISILSPRALLRALLRRWRARGSPLQRLPGCP
ncbi:cation channel sperm-associated auxiliary subunit delta [Suncus etruscus]|uniref:cation channel sperm-associated auxiliary subunit delta n=1 Tax=Suncus etruscus TaxID=109475 RepID=UPI00210F7518|nr:cation channel sperm-associated auxiliary subunit delta [Suncus etruscus]